MKINRKLTKTEIQWGIISYSEKTKKEFFDKLPKSFDVVYGKTTLESRSAGKNKMWLTVDLLREFKIGQILTLEIKNDMLYVTIDSNQNPSTMTDFTPFSYD